MFIAFEISPEISRQAAASTGLFTGSFIDNTKARTFTGAFLPSQDEGFGYFEETNGQTGSVLLQPGL